MKHIRRPLLYLTFIAFGAQASILAAQTNTPTQTNSPTNSSTPNATLTPPCASIGTFGSTSLTNPQTGATQSMRASMYSLSAPATVYTLWVYCSGFSPNAQMAAAVYAGNAASIGSLIVQSAPQTVATGWNGFSVSPTLLSSPTYWLAYMYQSTGYRIYDASSPVSNLAYSNEIVTFGTFPSSWSSPVYGQASEAIYAAFCSAPTKTPTATNTPTDTKTFTLTYTPTNTGTILINTATPTYTPTSTNSPTPTITFTDTFTPNPSLTPSCGGSFLQFGNTNTSGSPQTVVDSSGFRACRYTLAQSGTIQTMSLYLPAQDAGNYFVETAIYSNNASTTELGNLLAQSVTQVSTAGWNVFQVPNTPVTAGDYWLAFAYGAGPVSQFAIVRQILPVANHTLAYNDPLTSWVLPGSGAGFPASQYVGSWYEPIVANYCPGVVNTDTPTDSPTMTPTPSPIPTITPLPCGASAAYFGSTNISGSSMTLQPVELLAYQNSLPVDGTVYSISLYATDYDTNDLAEVGLYSSQGTTMGSLIASSGSTGQTLTAGWNNFSLPASPVTAGNYWLTYLFQAPVSYSIVYQVPTPGVAPNTLAYDLNAPQAFSPQTLRLGALILPTPTPFWDPLSLTIALEWSIPIPQRIVPRSHPLSHPPEQSPIPGHRPSALHPRIPEHPPIVLLSLGRGPIPIAPQLPSRPLSAVPQFHRERYTYLRCNDHFPYIHSHF